MIIAECGQNFQGDINLAKQMIVSAKENGADLVKFQLYDSKKLYGEYQKTELTKEQAFELFNYGKEDGIEVFFSVFDTERVKWCEEMGVKRYKIAKTFRDTPTIHAIWMTGKPLIMSTEDMMFGHFRSSAARLYCVAKYPTELSDLQLSSIAFGIRTNVELYQGVSDHTIGIDCAKIALSRGAWIVEKHFTLDKTMEGADHCHSMLPEELKELVRFSKIVKEAL